MNAQMIPAYSPQAKWLNFLERWGRWFLSICTGGFRHALKNSTRWNFVAQTRSVRELCLGRSLP